MIHTSDLVQAGIVVCSATAAWLVNQRSTRSRGVAAVIGLCGQPLWFWSAWQAQQWGILALSVWYTLAWGRGVWNWRRHTVAPQGSALLAAEAVRGRDMP